MTTRLSRIQSWTEALRQNVIGDPCWVQEKNVFEYPSVTVEVVAILKLIRAVQSLKALELLRSNGLFIDMGTIYRPVADCVSEIYFLLEDYPNTSSKVKKFIDHFSRTTIETHLDPGVETVSAKKIQNAMARVRTGSENDHQVQETIKQIYTTFSGYVHSNYSHIMSIYGGSPGSRSFNLDGVPSENQKRQHRQLLEQAELSIQHVMAFMADKFKQTELLAEMNQGG